MRIKDVSKALDRIAPASLAEEWDNVGLLVGDAEKACRRLLLCIDLTEAVLAEARQTKADMVMAYHPVIFKPLPRLTAQAAPIVFEAVRSGLAVYSVHTAFDSAVGGANDALADALGMAAERSPLRPRCEAGGYKVVVFMPESDLSAVSAAAFGAGAGRIGEYIECGWRAEGVGSFHGSTGTNPTVGQAGRREDVPEVRWECVCPRGNLAAVVAAVREAHSYEEMAMDVYSVMDAPAGVGLGRVGRLKRPAALQTMLARVRKACGVRRLLLTGPRDRQVTTLAVGCGSCGSMFRDAVAAGADLYVTGELRHHDALAAAAAGLTVACVGHSNSERLTLLSIRDRLLETLPKLDVRQAQADCDPFEIM